MTMTIERRTLSEPVQFRAADGKLTAYGYASVFNKLSENLGGFVEQIAPGAFTKTILEQDVRALFNHSEDHVLGRTTSGTLRLAEDDTGLAYEVDMPDTTAGRDVATLLERGDVSGSSFGFRIISQERSETADGYPLHTITEVSLRDVGPVTFPAYTDASSALRSLAEACNLDLDVLIAASRSEQPVSPVDSGDSPPTDEGEAPDEIHAPPTRKSRSWTYS